MEREMKTETQESNCGGNIELTDYPECLNPKTCGAKSFSPIKINIKVNDIGVLTEAARKLNAVRSEQPFTEVRFEVDLTRI